MKWLFAAKPDSNQFAKAYLKNLQQHHDVSRYIGADACRVHDLAHMYDVLWLEWANDFTRAVLDQKKPATFTIVRVHDWELRTGFAKKLRWDRVDLVWCVNKNAERDFINMKLPYKRIMTLPNAIDAEHFPSIVAEDTKKIAMLSISMNKRKGYPKAMDILRMLPDYELHIRAAHSQDTLAVADLAKKYGVSDRLFLDLRTAPACRDLDNKEDVIRFFSGKSHILSTSTREAFHYAIGEGMLCGLSPVVLDWDWGDAKQFWEPYVVDSPFDAAHLIKNTAPSEKFRTYVLERFAAERLSRVLAKEVYMIANP